MHLDPAPERASRGRREQRFELAAPGAAAQPAGDEDRLALRRHSQPLELADRRLERRLARIDRGARERQLRRLDHERGGAAARRERLERRAGEREAKRVADRRADVGDRFLGRARAQHERVVRRV